EDQLGRQRRSGHDVPRDIRIPLLPSPESGPSRGSRSATSSDQRPRRRGLRGHQRGDRSSERELVRAGPTRSDLPVRSPDAHPRAAARAPGAGPEQGLELSRVIDFDSINRGFSAKALVYDDYGADHPVILWARGQVRGQLMALVSPGAKILELAAGT